MNAESAAGHMSRSGWPENTIPVFNHVFVSSGVPGVCGESVCEDGRFSVHGDYGRVCSRITDVRIESAREAQLVAEHILRTSLGDEWCEELAA